MEFAADPLQLATALRRSATRLVRRVRAERLDPSLSTTKLSVLGHLVVRGPMTAGDLADADRLQPQSLTRPLGELVAAGLVRRVADPADRRRAVLSITADGFAQVQRDMAQRDAWLAAAIDEQVSPEERRALGVAAGVMERLAELGTVRAPR